MSTASYSQRSPFKWKYAALVIMMIGAMAAAVSFQIDRWLPGYALSFSQLIGQQSQTKISFRTVRYRFPNRIIFKNVLFQKSDGKDTIVQASRVVMGFNYLNISDMVINYQVLKNYLTRHGKKLHAWARTFPKGKMHLVVPNGKLYLTPQTPPIAFNVDMDLDGDRLSSHGSWRKGDKFNYKLHGNIRDSGFDLDNLTLEDGRSSMNLWGSWHGKSIDWKGFIFYNKLYILDIDGRLFIQPNDLALEHLSFSVNGDKITASADCSKQKFFQCDADIASQNTRLHLHAQKTSRGLVFSGWTDLDRLHVDFKSLEAWLINSNFLKLRILQTQSTFPIQNNKYVIPLDDLWASIHFSGPDQKSIALSSRVYGGHLQSRISLDTAAWPWQVKGQGQINGVDINRLSGNFLSLKQCHGLLSGNFILQTSKASPRPELTGTLVLRHGDFDGSGFQEWVARTLQMPSLDHLPGTNFSSRFKTDGKSMMLDDLKLDTDDLDLYGYFHLDADDLVSSQASVRFSKMVLSESPIGRSIMGLVHGAWTLPFEFSLSGNLYRMNFEWDNSPLKNKVRRHLFSFFERMIDRRMDAHHYYNVTIPSESVSPG